MSRRVAAGRLRWPAVALAIVSVANCGGQDTIQSSAPSDATTRPPTGTTLTGQPPPVADIPWYRPGPGNVAIHPGPGPEHAPVVAWEVDLGSASTAIPVVVGGSVIVGTESGEVRALDAHTGEDRWPVPFVADGPILDTLTATRGSILFTTGRSVYALAAADGQLEWSESLAAIGTRPVRGDGVFFVGQENGTVTGLDSETHEVRWTWTDPEGRPARVELVEPDGLYVSLAGSHLESIDLESATVRWSYDGAGSGVSVVSTGNTIYVSNVAVNGAVAALDGATGARRWQYPAPEGRQTVVGAIEDGILYLSSEAGGLYAIRDDGEDWSPVWEADGAPAAYWPAVRASGLTFIAGADGSVAALRDDAELWRTEPRPGEIQGPLVTGGLVIETAPRLGIVRAWAEPELIALIDEPRSTLPPVDVVFPPNPFRLRLLATWADLGVEVPLGLDVGPDGTVYLLDREGTVTLIAPDGAVTGRWGERGNGPGQLDMANTTDERIGDLIVDGEGRVHITDVGNHRVQTFTGDGQFVALVGSFGEGDGRFSRPVQLAADDDGALYVTDRDNYDLQKFDRDGGFVWRIGRAAGVGEVPKSAEVHGVLVRDDGTMLLFSGADVPAPVFVVSAADGDVLGTWGESGDEPGQVSVNGEPSADGDGNVYVSQDGPAQAVQAFAADGSLLGGVYHEPGGAFTGRPPWSRVFWPAPVFGPGGVAYTLAEEGLMSVEITFPP